MKATKEEGIIDFDDCCAPDSTANADSIAFGSFLEASQIFVFSIVGIGDELSVCIETRCV